MGPGAACPQLHSFPFPALCAAGGHPCSLQCQLDPQPGAALVGYGRMGGGGSSAISLSPAPFFLALASSGQSCSDSCFHFVSDPGTQSPLTQTLTLSLHSRGGTSFLLLLIWGLFTVSYLASQPLLPPVLPLNPLCFNTQSGLHFPGWTVTNRVSGCGSLPTDISSQVNRVPRGHAEALTPHTCECDLYLQV